MDKDKLCSASGLGGPAAKPTAAQRRARDYFLDTYPWMRTTARTLTLAYSPNIDGYGRGWIMEIGSMPDDTKHWHGADDLFKVAYIGTIQAHARRRFEAYQQARDFEGRGEP